MHFRALAGPSRPLPEPLPVPAHAATSAARALPVHSSAHAQAYTPARASRGLRGGAAVCVSRRSTRAYATQFCISASALSLLLTVPCADSCLVLIAQQQSSLHAVQHKQQLACCGLGVSEYDLLGYAFQEILRWHMHSNGNLNVLRTCAAAQRQHQAQAG